MTSKNIANKENREDRKKALEKKISDIDAQKKKEQKEYQEQLRAIEKEEAEERDLFEFNKLVAILDNGNVILLAMSHDRTTCSDENPINDYTTMGRGGYFRCGKCGLMQVVEKWKSNRDWLIETKSATAVMQELDLEELDLSVDIRTYPE